MCNIRKEERIILYYPSIKIEDGMWLRNALLYWDKVSSIVPGFNYNESNSIEIEYLREAGLYEPIYPSVMWGNDELCKEFCEQVRKNLKHRRVFSTSRKYSQIHTDKMVIQNENMVHIEKTPDTILNYLLDAGIAKRNCDGPWINMNEYDANIYMATLARYLARAHGNVEIGTDKSTKFLYPYVPEKSKKVIDKQIYLNVAMQDILPVPSADISIQDIIDFKNQYKDQLKCFRRRIDEFQWSLKGCGCVEEIQERMMMLQHEIKYDIDEIEELLSSNRIKKEEMH